MTVMRLQKYLAQAGIASRRASEQLICDGRVALNGATVTSAGQSVDTETDQVTFDGNPVILSVTNRTIMLYKPRGYICSTNSSQGRTVFELLEDIKERIYSVGRLDKDSEGLLLLTNNGDLANRLTHPRYNQHKRYEVTVSGIVTDITLKKLNGSMLIDGYRIRPVEVSIQKRRQDSDKTELIFDLHEGRNRQIRKMCEAVNLRIHRLTRTQMGNLTLDNLHAGEWRDLTQDELSQLS